MSKNKSLITAFSLSPESEKVLNRLRDRSGKTRSEIVRNLINANAKSDKYQDKPARGGDFIPFLNADDTDKILKYYYQLISSQAPKPTLVIGIVIISQKGKVLIGLRKGLDQYVKNLSWTFPTGKFNSLNFELELRKTIKTEVGLTAKSLRLIHARMIPDSPAKKIRIVALYYHCKTISGKPVAGADFKQIKWVPTTDVTIYFTTSVADEIMNFLGTL